VRDGAKGKVGGKPSKDSPRPDPNWENWDQNNLEHEDEMMLEKKRELLQRELARQLESNTEEPDRKGGKKGRSRSSSSSSTTSSSSTDSSSSESSSSSSDSSTTGPKKKVKKVKEKGRRGSSASSTDVKSKKKRKLAKKVERCQKRSPRQETAWISHSGTSSETGKEIPRKRHSSASFRQRSFYVPQGKTSERSKDNRNQASYQCCEAWSRERQVWFLHSSSRSKPAAQTTLAKRSKGQEQIGGQKRQISSKAQVTG